MLIASAIFAALPAAAEEKSLLPCRPTIACTAELAPAGVLQVELGYLRRDLGDGVVQHSVPFLLKLTILDRLEAQLGSNGFTASNGALPARYHDDLQAGLKARFSKGAGWWPTLAFSLQLGVPTPGAQRGYVKTVDLLLTGFATEMLPLGFQADLNLGADVLRIEGVAQAQPWAALALSRDLPLGLTAMVETYRFADAAPLARKDAGVLAALSWSLLPWAAFDAGADVSLFPQDRRFSLFAGVTVAATRLWNSR